MTSVFLWLIVSPIFEHANENSSVCGSWAGWATSAASSGKRWSRVLIIFRFRFALRRARLKRRPPILVCSLIPIVDELKVLNFFNSIEKKIPKRVGASTQPCFTLLLISNDSETLHHIVWLTLFFYENTSQHWINLDDINFQQYSK